MGTISNIFIDQGATFTTTITVGDGAGSELDLTGYTAIAQLRKTYDSTTSIAFTVSFPSPRTLGQVTILLTDTQTAALEFGRYVYDVVLTTTASEKIRVVEGVATVSPSVSRS